MILLSNAFQDMPELKTLGFSTDQIGMLPSVYEATGTGVRGTNYPNFFFNCLKAKPSGGYDLIYDPDSIDATCASIAKAYPRVRVMELDIEQGFASVDATDLRQRLAIYEMIVWRFGGHGFDVWGYSADPNAEPSQPYTNSLLKTSTLVLSAYPWTNDPVEYGRVISSRSARIRRSTPGKSLAIQVTPLWFTNFVGGKPGTYMGDDMWNQQLKCAYTWGDHTILYVGDGGATGARKWATEDGNHEWVAPLVAFVKSPSKLTI